MLDCMTSTSSTSTACAAICRSRLGNRRNDEFRNVPITKRHLQISLIGIGAANLQNAS